MMLRRALRAAAVAIAVAAMMDPVFTSTEEPPRPIVAVDLTAGRAAAALRALQDAMPDRPVITRTPTSARVPCASDEDCVLVADGSVDASWEQRSMRPVSLITVPPADGINVRVSAVTASGGHRAAAGVVRVALHGSGVERQRTEVRVFDGAAVVGAATHTWTTTPSVTLDVPWWPLEAGARALRVDAAPIDGEVMLVDNQAAIGATVSARPADVLVFDARPSWHSTFVRRALEDDARFSVEHRSRLAPALTAGTAGGRLDAAALDRAALLVIGGPDALTAADVDLLERYTRVRGGSLLLLPDRRPSGPVARLFDGTWTEQLSPAAAAIGPLRASEVLRARSLSPAVTVIATAAGAPSIASLPRGEGRIVVAGAMDAWRYRTDAFDRFWRSLAADAAAAGQPLTLAFDDPLAAAGGHARFTFRDRAMAPPSALEASAVQRCNDGPATVIRLWPAGPLGEFSGEAAADAAGRCVVEARAAHRQVSASLAVMDRPARGVDRTLAKLERQARGSGGAIADAGNLSTIARALETSADAMSRVVTVHPMRSPWWLLPFAASLSIEWWLRRRHGLR